jgi:hypothetical protein
VYVKAKCLSRLRSTWDDTLANSTFTVVRNVQLASHQDDHIKLSTMLNSLQNTQIETKLQLFVNHRFEVVKHGRLQCASTSDR